MAKFSLVLFAVLLASTGHADNASVAYICSVGAFDSKTTEMQELASIKFESVSATPVNGFDIRYVFSPISIERDFKIADKNVRITMKPATTGTFGRPKMSLTAEDVESGLSASTESRDAPDLTLKFTKPDKNFLLVTLNCVGIGK